MALDPSIHRQASARSRIHQENRERIIMSRPTAMLIASAGASSVHDPAGADS